MHQQPCYVQNLTGLNLISPPLNPPPPSSTPYLRPPLHFLQEKKVVVITRTFILITDAKSDLDHSVNASRKLRWLVQVEARGETRRIQKEPDQILHCLDRIVCRRLFLQLRHDGVRWIDLHGFFWTPCRMSSSCRVTPVLSLCAPYWQTKSSDVVRPPGESKILSLTITFSTLSPSTSSTPSMVRTRLSAPQAFSSHLRHQDPILPSLWISASFRRIPSAVARHIHPRCPPTSRPFLRKFPKNGEEDTYSRR